MFRLNLTFEKDELKRWRLVHAAPLGSGITAFSSWLQSDLQFRQTSIEWQIEQLDNLKGECTTGGNSCEELFDEVFLLVRVYPEFSPEKALLLDRQEAVLFLKDLKLRLNDDPNKLELSIGVIAEGQEAEDRFIAATGRPLS